MTDQTVTTSATGRRNAVPDLAVVEVNVITGGATASAARTTVRDRAATIRESLAAVSPDTVETAKLRVEDASDEFGSTVDAPYQAVEQLRIDCVPDTAASVVAEVTDAGGTVTDVQFIVHEDRVEQLEEEALTDAMTRARTKAEHVAAAEGLRLGDVQQITTEDPDTSMAYLADDILCTDLETELQPSPITISERVEVIYELIEN